MHLLDRLLAIDINERVAGVAAKPVVDLLRFVVRPAQTLLYTRLRIIFSTATHHTALRLFV